ncbi:DoxX family membrane protein [Embleya sp. NBC_00896]|uniref:DoxX family membrane protein n=1 Tax=Embleya sp. NBC_00896 TaxID=2975961 RepID=UPI002F90E52D|nr:DoxX family membrane protein [Embleya sp. NBC_00896]
MSSSHGHRLITRFHLPNRRTAPQSDVTTPAALPAAADTRWSTSASVRPAEAATAGLRVLLGVVFLWAFLDKTFGLGYATHSGKGWADGGSPTEGFLSHVNVGPMASTLRGWAGAGWADWLFMLGLFGIGTALILGIGLRLAAAAGTAMMGLMWIAEWPPAKHLDSGAPSMSTNPFADYHLVYAAAIVVLATAAVGSRLGLGARWAALPTVRRNPWLL